MKPEMTIRSAQKRVDALFEERESIENQFSSIDEEIEGLLEIQEDLRQQLITVDENIADLNQTLYILRKEDEGGFGW